MDKKPSEKKRWTPKAVVCARRKLTRKHRNMQLKPSNSTQVAFKVARKNYRASVRNSRLHQSIKRDKTIDTILTNDPRQIYSYLRRSRKARTTKIIRTTQIMQGQSSTTLKAQAC